jgi:hypothetical protein
VRFIEFPVFVDLTEYEHKHNGGPATWRFQTSVAIDFADVQRRDEIQS